MGIVLKLFCVLVVPGRHQDLHPSSSSSILFRVLVVPGRHQDLHPSSSSSILFRVLGGIKTCILHHQGGAKLIVVLPATLALHAARRRPTFIVDLPETQHAFFFSLW